MMTRKNLALLAAADPWGLETGGCPGIGDRSDSWKMHGYGLGQVDVPIVGADVEAAGAAGDKIVAGMEAGDINAVAEGMEEGLEAIESGTAKLGEAWSDAAKFMMLFSPTVTAPVLGHKVTGGAYAAGIRLPMWGQISSAKLAQIRAVGGTIVQTTVKTAQQFMDKVSEGWLFPDSAWDRFSLTNPRPGGVYGEIWNPFGGRWQPKNQPLPAVGSQAAIAQEAEIEAYQGDLLQRDVDNRAKTMPGALALATLRVRARKYRAANLGTEYAGKKPWGIQLMIYMLTAPHGGAEYPIPAGKSMIEDYRISLGPLRGQTYRKMRIAWIKRLQEIVAEMPAEDRPKNAAALAAATVSGQTDGQLVTGNGARTKGFGAGAVMLGAGALGLLWFLMA